MGRIKIRSPFVQVKPLRTHEVRTISKNKVSVFNGIKHKEKIAPSNKVAMDDFSNQGPPISQNPAINGLRGRPEANEFPDEPTLNQMEGQTVGPINRKFNQGDVDLLHKSLRWTTFPLTT